MIPNHLHSIARQLKCPEPARASPEDTASLIPSHPRSRLTRGPIPAAIMMLDKDTSRHCRRRAQPAFRKLQTRALAMIRSRKSRPSKILIIRWL